MATKGRYSILRARFDDRVALPFRVRSIGCGDMSSTFTTRDIEQDFFELLWAIDGKGRIEYSDTSCQLLPGNVTIIFPGTKRRYHTLGEQWSLRWLTLTGPLMRSVFESLGIDSSVTVRKVGGCPEELFKRLEVLTADVSERGIRESCQLAFQIMLLATAVSSYMENNNSHLVQTMIAYIEQRFDDPNLNVDWLAGKLQKHRSSLSRQFKSEIGLSPSDYIIQTRLRRAMELLRTTSDSLSKISKACGFNNPDYFIRLFHQKIGLTPGAYRDDGRI